MRIQELEKCSGIDRTTIRFYEREGLLAPQRSGNGYRDYSDDDVRELERIRLMRELGLSLEQIRGLQDGTLRFHNVMDVQCSVLKNRETRMHRAGSVCRTLADSGIGYRELDTDYYQKMLNASALEKAGQQGSGEVQPYSEDVEKEFHPIRRYIARMLDYGLLQGIVHFVLVLFFGWRTTNTYFGVMRNFVTIVLTVPIQALFLRYWGTTPGKWVMGIRVRPCVGDHLSYEEAFGREFQALVLGCGLYLPIISIIAMLYQLYTGLKKGQEYLPWDEDTEVCYDHFSGWVLIKLVLVPVLWVLPVGMVIAAEPFQILPVYAGNSMGIHEFANNFNTYSELLDYSCMRIDPATGVYGGSRVIIRTTLESGKRVEYFQNGSFEYEFRLDNLKVISYEHAEYRLTLTSPDGQEDWGNHIDQECIVAMLSVAAAQKGMGIQEIEQFRQALDQQLAQDASQGITWTYGNVMYSWRYDAEPVESDEYYTRYRVEQELKIIINSAP